MPIPGFSNDGVLPPFLGSSPGDASGLMSPYLATSLDVVQRFAQNRQRIDILEGWLNHRIGLRNAGFQHGFQWLDGSFVEDKMPRDLDTVSFIYMGQPSFPDVDSAWSARELSLSLFDRKNAKDSFHVDAFFIDLLDTPEVIVDASRYFLGLFSHQRTTMIWKGMLQVRLEDDNVDQEALEYLREMRQQFPEPDPELGPSLPLFAQGGIDNAS